MTSLVERVLDVFPSGHYGMAALLRVVELQESAEVSTAAIECSLNPCLRINPDFVDVHANTPEKLLMLLMHELHHILLGHTVLFRNPTPLDNLVLDAVINATLCRMFPGREFTTFFTDFYSAEKYPECLLRPPRRWSPHSYGEVPPVLSDPARSRALEAHRMLYSGRGAFYQEVYEALRDMGLGSSEGSGAMDLPVLIGSHGEATAADYENTIPAILPVVRNWHDWFDRVCGRSWSDVVQEAKMRIPQHSPNRKILARLIGKVARAGGNSEINSISRATVAGFSVIPSHSRRAVVLRALQVPQLLYEFRVTARTRERPERVHVYVDVSGSMAGLVDDIYAAVLDCYAMVHPKVHLFSTVVVDTTLDKIRDGFCRTTFGTDIACVADHMAASGVTRAVMLTDGFVGSLPARHRDRWKKSILGVAVPRWGHMRSLRNYVQYVEKLSDRTGKDDESL
jgi:hypothetical protein